jgi:peptide/nickel transport system permease protein
MDRRRFLLRKAGLALLTIIVVFGINFVLFRVLPGDPVRSVIGRGVRITPETQDALRAQFGLDRPVFPDQLVDTAGQWLQGNLGISWSLRRPVTEVLASKLWNTVILVGLAQLIAIVLGVLLGMLAGWKRKTPLDTGALGFSLVAWSIPTFWLGIILLVAGSSWFGLPTAGVVSPENTGKPLLSVLPDFGRHLLLPALTLTIVFLGEYMLIMRSSIREVLADDYILTARAKGLSEWQVLRRHALRNALLPIVTVIAINVGFIVAGAIYVETVFSYDGLGKLFQTALVKQDYPLLQGAFMLLAVSVVIANLTADLLYVVLDPRVKDT